MTRGGRTKDRSEPKRRCIAGGDSGVTLGMIRFVVGPDGLVVPDLAEKLPGRGIWVRSSRATLDRAERKGLFARAAKALVKPPAGLSDLIEGLLVRRVQDLIAMARKAGLAIAGHDKVKGRLKEGPVGALIEARDGAEQGKARLRPMAGDAPCIACLSGAELGLAFGRDHVIHAALDGGGITDRILRDAARLNGLRGEAAPSGPLLHSDERAGAPPGDIG